jgi:hypothetical protein
MEGAAQAFAEALELERQAAMRADFDTLARVQEETKRASSGKPRCASCAVP